MVWVWGFGFFSVLQDCSQFLFNKTSKPCACLLSLPGLGSYSVKQPAAFVGVEFNRGGSPKVPREQGYDLVDTGKIRGPRPTLSQTLRPLPAFSRSHRQLSPQLERAVQPVPATCPSSKQCPGFRLPSAPGIPGVGPAARAEWFWREKENDAGRNRSTGYRSPPVLRPPAGPRRGQVGLADRLPAATEISTFPPRVRGERQPCSRPRGAAAAALFTI